MSDDFFDELSDLAPESGPEANLEAGGTVEISLTKLAALVEDLNGDLSPSTILDRAMNAAIELTGAERGFLVLTTENGEWSFQVARNMRKGDIENAESEASRTIIKKVLDSRKPILINDVVGASDISKQQSIAKMQVRSIMGAPLISKGKLLGAAYVDTSKLAGVFDQTSLVLFGAFVHLAAVALENARLIEAERIARERYQHLQEYLGRVLQSQPHGVMILDSDLKIDYTNHQSAVLLDRDTLKAGDDLSEECFKCERGANLSEQILEFLTTGISSRYIFTRKERTLAYSFFQVNADEFGHRRIGMIVENITLQKDLEKKLIESEKRSTVNQLAGGIAHEINNSLQPVKGRVELLEMKLKKDGVNTENGLHKDFETIDSLIVRIEKIVRNLRSLSKPSQPEFAPLDLCDLTYSTVDLLENTTGTLRSFKRNDPKSSYRIELSLSENVPLIVGDRHGLESALINMVINSCHAILEKDEGCLSISVQSKEDRVVLQVRDTGMGMKPEVFEHIFDPYFTTKGDGGTGLGMCIIQNIADVHGATLELQSSYGEGTTITLAFPALKENAVLS